MRPGFQDSGHVFSRRPSRGLFGLISCGIAFLALPAAARADGALYNLPPEILHVVLLLPAFLLGIGLHEWAHASTAWRLGDNTAANEGRLSLNPLDHLDPMGTLFIFVAVIKGWPLIGWGRPVPVSLRNFRRPIRDHALVAAAGPMMNVLIAATACVLVAALNTTGGSGGVAGHALRNVDRMLRLVSQVNFMLAVFNLIPIPPLDGSRILENYLDARQTLMMRQIQPYGFMILLVLIQTPLLEVPFGKVWVLMFALWSSPGYSLGFLLAVVAGWSAFLRTIRSQEFGGR